MKRGQNCFGLGVIWLIVLTKVKIITANFKINAEKSQYNNEREDRVTNDHSTLWTESAAVLFLQTSALMHHSEGFLSQKASQVAFVILVLPFELSNKCEKIIWFNDSRAGTWLKFSVPHFYSHDCKSCIEAFINVSFKLWHKNKYWCHLLHM